MPGKPDPDQLKGPGGMSMRQLHELVKQSAARDRAAGRTTNQPEQKPTRWQRLVRYVWGKQGG